jgi:hypothetical protein
MAEKILRCFELGGADARCDPALGLFSRSFRYVTVHPADAAAFFSGMREDMQMFGNEVSCALLSCLHPGPVSVADI